jgi:YjbE family integral membrane protein
MTWVLPAVVPLLEIIGINLVLSGDNAVVVALAVRHLLPQHRRPAVVLGMGGAMVLQILATLMVSWLFRLPLVLCAGGLCLSWIALRVLREERRDKKGLPQPEGLGHAVWTILVANCVMSLDNVLAIASIGHGQPEVIVMGLGVSILLTLTSSIILAAWMTRYPFLVILGAGILAWTSGRMITTDAVVSQSLTSQLGVDLKDGPLWYALSLVMTALVLVAARKGKRERVVTEHASMAVPMASCRYVLERARLYRRPR